MSGDNQIRRLDDAEYIALPPPPASQPEQVNLFRLVHRLLRGRYALAIALAMVGGVAGVVGGYLASTPKYRAEGTIRIQPVLPKILYESEQSSIQPMFVSFVNTQAYRLRQPRVLEMAQRSEAWRALGRPVTPDSEREFRDSLKVTTARDAPELIFVSFVDKDARAAFVALGEVVKAYKDIEEGESPESVKAFTIETLMQRRAGFERERDDLAKLMNAKMGEFATSDLQIVHNDYLQEQLRLESQVGELEVSLTQRGVDIKNLPAAPPPAQPADTAVAEARELTPDQIALLDPQMSELVSQRDAASQVISRLRADGVGERHPDFVRAFSDVTLIKERISTYAKQWNEQFGGEAAAAPAGAGMESTAQLVERYRLLKQLVGIYRERTSKVNAAMVDVQADQRKIQRLDQQIAETSQRIDAINLESKMVERIGRINVDLPTIPPSSPTVDSRFKLAAMGFVAGSGLPVALIMLLGLLDRRLRYSDQTDSPSLAAPMLGILPHLPDKSADPGQVAAAIHAVHNIRTLLQLSTGAKNKVYAITSPTAGDGKTSLALSLAMSFAAAGSRTALVDFDLVGQGLSSRLRLDPAHGIGEALAAGHLNGSCTVTNPFPGLSVIGPKPGDVALVSRIPSDHVAVVLDELRSQYDTVIVDTGPILGSLEATMTVAAADAVVLVVGRGQHQPNIQSALAQLAKLRANCVGLVFNRAHSADFNRSAGTASLRSVRTADIQRAKSPALDPALQQLDPLARSMATELHPAADQ